MSEKKPACSNRTYKVTTAQINKTPLSCPMENMEVWNAHPKVFLPIMKAGKAVCSYCGALYILTDFDPNNASDVTDTESN